MQVHCYDEYSCHVDKEGHVSDQRARVRLFCLSFLTGMPVIEIGLNDLRYAHSHLPRFAETSVRACRREGNEVVRRKDIMPMYTEKWIRTSECVELHSIIDNGSYERDKVIR